MGVKSASVEVSSGLGEIGYSEHGWPEGTEWRDGEDRLYRVERMTRREAIPPAGEWKPLWTVMEPSPPSTGTTMSVSPGGSTTGRPPPKGRPGCGRLYREVSRM